MTAATLYPGKANSPPTFLTAPYTVGDGLLNVDDTSVFPAAPNIVVVAASATDITTVTYIYTAIGVNQLTGISVLEGTDKDWPANTPAGRNFTNYDYQAIQDALTARINKATNVTAINDTGIADGEIALFNLTNKDIRTSDKTIVTTLGSDDTTVPTSKAVKDVTDTHILKDGTRAFTGDQSMGSKRLTNVAAPTTAGDALPYQAWAAWTPTLTWSTATPTGITTVARWTQVGKIVFIDILINVSDSNATTGLTISLPAAHASNNINSSMASLEGSGASGTTYTNPFGTILTGESVVRFLSFVTMTDGAAGYIRVTGQYEVA